MTDCCFQMKTSENMGAGNCKHKPAQTATLATRRTNTEAALLEQLHEFKQKTRMFGQLRSQRQSMEMPKLPLPSLTQTIKKYLIFVKVQQAKRNMSSVQLSIDQFLKGDGPKLQKKLIEIANKSRNWSNDFWFSEFFLVPRHPIPIFNSRGVLLPKQKFFTKSDHLIFAAKVIHSMIELHLYMQDYQLPVITRSTGQNFGNTSYLVIDPEELGTVFRGYRMPGIDRDVVVRAPDTSDNEHVIIAYKTHLFALNVINDRNLQSIESIYQALISCETIADKYEEQSIGILTCDDRNTWASTRKLLSRDNKHSLSMIEKGLFVVCLDQSHDLYKSNRDLSLYMLCGANNNMANRWFDKPIQIIISSDGQWGLCYERSMVDDGLAQPLIHHLSMVIGTANFLPTSTLTMDLKNMRFETVPSQCFIIKWKLSDNILLRISLAIKYMMGLTRDLDYTVSEFNQCGFDFLRKNNISPSAFMHLAFHVAYYKMYNVIGNIYTAVSLRKFKHGREENCRSATPELIKLCEVMNDEGHTKKKLTLLKKALSRQSDLLDDTMKGQGLDNHLLALLRLADQTLTVLPDFFKCEDFKNFSKYAVYTKSIEIPTTIRTCPGLILQDGYSIESNVMPNKIVVTTVQLKDVHPVDSSALNEALLNTMTDMVEIIGS